ncbi:transportin-3-like protein [Dinothrombium tinctorium]|uniref:Transportin-3-like protein n=1 Tax=Dinothrombium tinctorium TaxID=1965070 RepID=A0A3S3NR16_9ACAR|nr:transportin-3-like protein [Dinothrombium tinctorium]
MSSNEMMSAEIQSQPELSVVLSVIKTLYNNESLNENKEMASQWLGNLQKSIYAWKISDELLINKCDVESCYFAAQTLRTKIQFNFNELPPEAYSSLKDSIINHLKSINESVIQTQLALAITYLAILVPSWTNPIEELVSQNLNRSVLIEILTLLPEELDMSRHQNLRGIGANRRQQFTAYLSKIAPQIITLLQNTLQETQAQATRIQSQNSISNEKLIAKTYRCLGAWITIIDKNDINLIEPLLSAIFNSLRDTNCSDVIHDAASDTISGAALLCEDYEKYHQLTHYLLNQIYQLEVVYHHSVANEDIDKSVNYARIFTEMAETIVNPLVIQAAYATITSNDSTSVGIPGLKIVDLLLDCVGHYDYEVAEITFHFWYRFSELVNKKGTHLLNLFGSVANRLLLGLTRHCKLEPDHEGLLGLESDLHEFRLRVRDLVKEIVFIIGASNYLAYNNIVSTLQSELSLLISNPSTSQVNWEEVEAKLFIISCIIRDVYDNEAIISQIISMIMMTAYNKPQQLQQQHSPQPQPSIHPQILTTCCVILGELSDWLEASPHYLDSVLSYLLTIITSCPKPTNINSNNDQHKTEQTTLSSVAAASLQQIIGCCASKHLIGNWNLISILIQICSQLDLILNENAAHNLLQCCSTIISTSNESQSRQQQEQLIVQLLSPHLTKLKDIVTGKEVGTSRSDPVIYLDRIASVFRNLRLIPVPESENMATFPLKQTINDQMWPLIHQILTQTSVSGDSRIVERSCRCLRFVIRCLKPYWLLQPVATTIVSLYQQYPKHSSYLYLASILADEFLSVSDEVKGLTPEQMEEINNGLISMLNAFCLSTFQLLTAPECQLRNHPDTIDDFFRLCTRFLQKNATKFLTESMLDSIINLTIASIQLNHREANNSVTKFLIELLDAGKSVSSEPKAKQAITRLLHEQDIGQKLMDALINCALFGLPSYFVPDMAEILWELITWDRAAVEKWLANTLKNVPTENKAGVVSATHQQLQEFYESVTK